MKKQVEINEFYLTSGKSKLTQLTEYKIEYDNGDIDHVSLKECQKILRQLQGINNYAILAIYKVKRFFKLDGTLIKEVENCLYSNE